MLLAVNGGKAVGVLYGFIWGNTFAYYQGGWDAAWARFSLGTVLVRQAIRFAMLSGAKHFDFLRGAEPYKYRFGATDRIDETWLLPRGYSGWLLNRKYKLISTRRLKAARPLENCDEPTPSPLALAGCPRPTRSLHLTPAV
jgi:CelD/BcsL family acetyltransferase involved in cellulose biosynthesis